MPKYTEWVERKLVNMLAFQKVLEILPCNGLLFIIPPSSIQNLRSIRFYPKFFVKQLSSKTEWKIIVD